MTASISIHNSLKLDGSIKKSVMDFLEKLQEDPTNPSLRVKPIAGSADSRARTGRVTDFYRAVMFELRDRETHHFVIVGIYNHDDDIAKIKTATLRVNPINGITELVHASEPDPAVVRAEVESRVKAAVAEREALRIAEEQAREQMEERSVSAPPPVEAAPTRPSDALTDAGYTPQVLESELGIDPTSTEIVLGLESEDLLLKALEHRPAWESDAFIGLVAGMTIEEVKESLGMVAPVHGDADSRLVEGLKTPAARLEYAYLEGGDNDELRNVLESGDFASWRVFLHPSQLDVVTRSYSGSGRVFGGAGTGKTVVAVHRANRLASANRDRESPRVLLTTYTRVLADSLKSQMTALNPVYSEAARPGDSGLWISGIDQLVMRTVKEARPDELAAASEVVLGSAASRISVFNRSEEELLWSDVRALAGAGLSDELANDTFLSQEYEAVVLAHGITTQADYLRIPRTGRGTPLNRKARKEVWEIIERYMRACAMEGKVSWPVLAAIGAEILEQRAAENGPRMFDHVLVDEAQDFHAGHWKFIRSLVAEGPNDVFIAEDAHQRIYGQQYVLSRFGISTRGRASKRLTLNYRTTRETLDYAVRILDGEWTDAEGETDTTDQYRSARSGPKPALFEFSSEADEIRAVAGIIKAWMQGQEGIHVGVLARTKALVNRAVNGLAEHGIDIALSEDRGDGPLVQVMTMHSAKGMEFTHVVLIGVGRNVLPQRYQLTGLAVAEADDARQRERSLLYVAASRARDQLVITTHEELSELLPS
ncbi:3'-5' exonuclease [Flaviflexus huanghaiensis]|uniref:3'-5' exonuclease n=1 Tax=Flaviflexus huanghaiensis TaxID=1111473 RepID=UPI0015FD7B91|nr:3'-5' exonuclease [Flaviflexus huanghaiensis]